MVERTGVILDFDFPISGFIFFVMKGWFQNENSMEVFAR